MTRIITRTDHETRFNWPHDVALQGGSRGIVFNKDGTTYRTAFVEANPPGTFLRGEGATVAEAEEACWKQYVVYVNCDGNEPWHGPFEPRRYTNGCGFCTRCGTWMSGVLPVLPDDPNREPTILERLFTALMDDDGEEETDGTESI